MGRPGEAAAAKNPHLHAEIATVFLSDKISRRLRGAEEAVQTLVDAAVLADTLVVFSLGIVVTSLQLHQWQFVRSVAINLVGAHKDKDRVRAVLPRSLQQV